MAAAATSRRPLGRGSLWRRHRRAITAALAVLVAAAFEHYVGFALPSGDSGSVALVSIDDWRTLAAGQRIEVVSYLQTDGVGNLVALNGENIDEKIRGAMSLAMALPSYQLA